MYPGVFLQSLGSLCLRPGCGLDEVKTRYDIIQTARAAGYASQSGGVLKKDCPRRIYDEMVLDCR